MRSGWFTTSVEQFPGKNAERITNVNKPSSCLCYRQPSLINGTFIVKVIFIRQLFMVKLQLLVNSV